MGVLHVRRLFIARSGLVFIGARVRVWVQPLRILLMCRQAKRVEQCDCTSQGPPPLCIRCGLRPNRLELSPRHLSRPLRMGRWNIVHRA